MKRTLIDGLIFAALLYGAGFAGVLYAAHAAPACDISDPCGAEPAPLPRIYLPAVMQRLPSMSAESTPLQPVPTVTPDPPVSGDVQ